MLVCVAVEQQAIERGPQRQVILGPCGGRGGSGGAPVRGSGDGGASSWGSTGPGGPQGALGTQPPVWDTPGLMPQSRTAGGTAWRSSHRNSSSASLRHTQSCPSRAGPRAAGVTPDRGKHISPFGTEGSGAPPGRHLRCCPPSPTCLTCTRCPRLPLTPTPPGFLGPRSPPSPFPFGNSRYSSVILKINNGSVRKEEASPHQPRPGHSRGRLSPAVQQSRAPAPGARHSGCPLLSRWLCSSLSRF